MCSRWNTRRWPFECRHPRLVQFVDADLGARLSKSGLSFKWPQTGWTDLLNVNIRRHLMRWIDEGNAAIFLHLVMGSFANTFPLRLGVFNSCWITRMGIICRHFLHEKSSFDQCKLKKEVYLVCVSNWCVALRGWLIKAQRRKFVNIHCWRYTKDHE